MMKLPKGSKSLIFGLHFILLSFISVNGQIQEKSYLLDSMGIECFDIDSANQKIDIIEVIPFTYIVSYSYKCGEDWCKRRYYDEVLTNSCEKSFKIIRIHDRGCMSGVYRDNDKAKKIDLEKKDSLYLIIISNNNGDILQKGKSKYPFPFLWTDTLSFYSENKLYKEVIYDKDKMKVSYWDSIGNKIKITEDFDVFANFPNTNNSFEHNLRSYFAKTISYPEKAHENNICGRVYIKFVITKEGNIECVEAAYREIPILTAYSIELIKSLPKLSPATKNLIPVNVTYFTSVLFDLH